MFHRLSEMKPTDFKRFVFFERIFTQSVDDYTIEVYDKVQHKFYIFDSVHFNKRRDISSTKEKQRKNIF